VLGLGAVPDGLTSPQVRRIGAGREFHPINGGVYYWPEGGDLAVF
jgi:hypothetical protein